MTRIALRALRALGSSVAFFRRLPTHLKAIGQRLARGVGHRDRIISIASPLALLLLWELAVRAGLVDARFFPAPSRILGRLLGLAESGELWTNTWASLQRLFWGALVGMVPALVLGLLVGLYRPVRAIVEPLVAATHPVPKSAILPLIL